LLPKRINLSYILRSSRKIFYEVTIKPKSPQIRDQFISFLKNGHIKKVLENPGFISCDLAEDLHNGNISCRYTLSSENALDKYLNGGAAVKLRQETSEHFQDSSFEVTRRSMKILLSSSKKTDSSYF
jgi:Domain of unknown function (DUF4286)